MEPGKGYTFHDPAEGDAAARDPLRRHPCRRDAARRRLRIGGTMEFSGYDLTVDPRRIDNIFRLARDYIEVEEPGTRSRGPACGR